MTFKKTIGYFVFFITYLFASNLLANAAPYADMPQVPRIELVKLIDHYRAQQKTKNLTPEESQILDLSTTAKELFGVESLNPHREEAGLNLSLTAIDLKDIVGGIIPEIFNKDNWTEQISAENVKKLALIESLIKGRTRIETYEQYSIAWIKYQQGDKKTAKSILEKLFLQTYDRIMNSKREKNPYEIKIIERISEALTQLSTPTENRDRESKIQQMKIHVSNLPELQMMT